MDLFELALALQWSEMAQKQERKFAGVDEKHLDKVLTFLYKTPKYQVYPIDGPLDALVCFAVDTVADNLEISREYALRLLKLCLERQRMPFETPPKLQAKVDQRIEEDLERWRRQIREYVDTMPLEKRNANCITPAFCLEVAQKYDMPVRVVPKLIREVFGEPDIVETVQQPGCRSERSASVFTPAPALSPADEIMKYKQLLDCGAITEEEYNAKKKQLLNL